MQKHDEKHVSKLVYLPISKWLKVISYLKSNKKSFSGWIREKMNELITDKNL